MPIILRFANQSELSFFFVFSGYILPYAFFLLHGLTLMFDGPISQQPFLLEQMSLMIKCYNQNRIDCLS